jgi:hypothetical protein
MKKHNKQRTMILIAMWALAVSSAHAALVAGPNGGKIIGATPDRAEVVISDAGLVTVSFLDDQGQVAAAGDRLVKLFALLESGRQEIPFRVEGQTIVSISPLPQPEGYTLVVQIRSHAESSPVNARIQYISSTCGECTLKEYACTCENH